MTSKNERGLTRPVDAGCQPIVLKLGGSLAGSKWLGQLLEVACRSGRPVVFVPGGGTFAEAVRQAQRRVEFTDVAAHRMAILAMHQMAELYFEMQPGLRPAETVADIRRAWDEQRVPVWLPLRMALADPELPQDWSITSDGLAAWLAREIGGADVVLAKSCPVPPGATLKDLADAGIIDQVFERIAAEAHLDWHVLGPDAWGMLARLCGAPQVCE